MHHMKCLFPQQLDMWQVTTRAESDLMLPLDVITLGPSNFDHINRMIIKNGW